MSRGHERPAPRALRALSLRLRRRVQRRRDLRRRPALRWPAVATAALCLLVALVAIPSSGSATPRPHRGAASHLTVAQVQQRLRVLDRRGEIASEAYNTAQVRMSRAQDRLRRQQAALARSTRRVGQLRRAIVSAALLDYASTGGLPPSAAILGATSPSQFIDELTTSAVVEGQQADRLSELRAQQRALGLQEQRAQSGLAAISVEAATLARHKAALHETVVETRSLLSRLQARQRQRVLAAQRHDTVGTFGDRPSRASERPPAAPSAPPASGRAAVAVSTALAQVGKPYVYGAAGPDAFDCSGLTMYAWAAAGVSLSHSSSIQSQQGVPVAISDLRPGDLVFYYSPVSHVAMYIGNGMVVHAPHTGSVVQVVPLSSMPIAWARRVG